MSLTIINKAQFKPNLAIDMVRAAITHYRQYDRPIESIELNKRLWEMWVGGILEHKPELEDDLLHFQKMDFKMMFKDKKTGKDVGVYMEVRKGSDFMIKQMSVNLREKVA